jgi:hypothetical protein
MAIRNDAGTAPGCRPRDFSRWVMAMVPAVMASTSGAVARDVLARLPRWFGLAVFKLAIMSGTGAQLPDTLQHVQSRETVACAVLLWRSRRKSERHGFAHVVDGYTQKMILRLLINPQTGEPYSRSHMFGRNGRDEPGPMLRLREAGLYWRQPRTVDADPRFLGRARTRIADGKLETFRPAFAVYWLAEPDKPS